MMTRNIMIADDNEDMRFLMRAVLVRADFEVDCEASDGAEAMACWTRRPAQDRPHAVVLDHEMPLMTGIEVATRIRAEAPDQRIVLMSAYLDDEVVTTANQIGVLCLDKDQMSQLPGVL